MYDSDSFFVIHNISKLSDMISAGCFVLSFLDINGLVETLRERHLLSTSRTEILNY